MKSVGESKPAPVPPKRKFGRRLFRGCALGCAGVGVLFIVAIVLLFVFLGRVPTSYPPPTRPLPAASTGNNLGGGLDGFDSPYLGHTGSWNGKGGSMGGGSKTPDLDKEIGMGLRWTFMEVRWRAMEPDAPVDLDRAVPSAWQALDAFVIAAQKRGLNVLMQAPVVGGNAGGPPDWAGRRENGKSAPLKMDSLAAFAGKLAERYRPGGTLARREGWGERYGVRAWELDNEPESYRTHWNGQAADYAEFVTLAAAQIKAADPQAVIVASALASGKHGLQWLEATLDATVMAGSPEFRAQGKPFSIGPVADVVSLHNYEGLDSFFAGEPRTIVQVLDDVSAVFEKWEQRAPGFTYARKQDYWHTEGNFDFIGALSAERRAAWRMQFFTRSFAAGLRKVCVMDASKIEQVAVRAYVKALPWPFPMKPADAEVKVLRGRVTAFRHLDRATAEAGQVWILWATADTGDAQVEVPVVRERVTLVHVDGSETVADTPGHRLTVELKGDRKMAPPVIVVDRTIATKN
ncbi:MAG: hypothetical protein HOP33_10020 [Verrucomicrobia bacterium]|nr:hypothetical protein [Verrucomicrobiota bacterium]